MIVSTQNKIIKQILKLKTKKEREKTGLFIIEGERAVKQIPSNINIEYYIFSETFSLNYLSDELYKNVPKYIVCDNIFKKISETINSQGIIAICNMQKFELNKLDIKENTFFVILDRVMDPGNLGTIIRSAEAFGISSVILSKGCVDLYNDKVLRSTMGALFNIPIITDCNILDSIEFLKENNFTIIATHLNAEKKSFDIDFSGKVALIIGNEANGILDEYVNISDEVIKIPIIGEVESINVSIASSIIFYEALSQKLKIR